MNITEQHIKEFIQQLKEKGYTGKIFANDLQNQELADVLLNNVKSQSRELDLSGGFSFWMMTLTKGDLMSYKYTTCLMEVGYKKETGFKLEQMIVDRWDRIKDQSMGQTTITLKDMNELPDLLQLNRHIQSLTSKNQRKGPKL
ncbi:hypothetical protein [Chitinophaga sp. MM2321]|uniref:hypothetical protein n=1 Tax=Chitinophaga sp. MM2321 TaxID=3137178 RepID=UPI0032D5A762